MDIQGMNILIPRAEKARDILPRTLKAQGARVTVATAYRTVNSGRKKEELARRLAAGDVDVITFTSSSTVTNFFDIMGKDFTLPPSVRVACIGPVTAATAKQAGLSVDIAQEEYTMEGLVAALYRAFQKSAPGTGGGKEGKEG